MSEVPLRVGIVGGHPVIRGVVRLAAETLDGATVAVESSSLDEAARMLDQLTIDLLVLDLELPDGDGLTLLRTLAGRDAVLRPRVLVLSDRSDGATVLEAMRLGTSGFLTKAEGLRGLAGAMRSVVAGERVIPHGIEASAIAELRRYVRTARERAAVESELTIREREVLHEIAEGRTTQQVARRLGISPRTVETHVSNVYRKLGARSRVQALSRAASLGLIEL